MSGALRSVNIISGNKNWILGRMAEELTRLLGCTRNSTGPSARVDYCIPYSNSRHSRAPVKVGLFTHIEAAGPKREQFISALNKFDHTIALSKQTGDVMRGFGRAPSRVIHLGTDMGKPITFGVCGKVYDSGRKNEHFVREMVAQGLDVLACGKGWPCERILDYVAREAFYANIDYLVVTSAIEGGPVPVLEAMAMGVPIIAPDVGWCWDYPVIRYERNSLESLLNVLFALAKPRSWAECAAEHRDFFEGIL